MNDVAMDVGEPTLQTIVIKGQSLMIQAHQVQEGGVEVVQARRMFFGFEPESIAATVTVSFSDACPSQKTGEGVWVVVAPGTISLKKGHAPKFRAPYDQSVFQQSALFKVANQGSRRLVHDFCLHGVGFLNVGVRVPVGDPVAAGRITPVEELNHTHPFFQQAPGEDAVSGVVPFEIASLIGSVSAVNVGGLIFQAHHFRYRSLHATGKLVAGDACSQIVIARIVFLIALIQVRQQLSSQVVVLFGVA